MQSVALLCLALAVATASPLFQKEQYPTSKYQGLQQYLKDQQQYQGKYQGQYPAFVQDLIAKYFKNNKYYDSDFPSNTETEKYIKVRDIPQYLRTEDEDEYVREFPSQSTHLNEYLRNKEQLLRRFSEEQQFGHFPQQLLNEAEQYLRLKDLPKYLKSEDKESYIREFPKHVEQLENFFTTQFYHQYFNPSNYHGRYPNVPQWFQKYFPQQYYSQQYYPGQYYPGQYNPSKYYPQQYYPQQYPGQYNPSKYFPQQYYPKQYYPSKYYSKYTPELKELKNTVEDIQETVEEVDEKLNQVYSATQRNQQYYKGSSARPSFYEAVRALRTDADTGVARQYGLDNLRIVYVEEQAQVKLVSPQGKVSKQSYSRSSAATTVLRPQEYQEMVWWRVRDSDETLFFHFGSPIKVHYLDFTGRYNFEILGNPFDFEGAELVTRVTDKYFYALEVLDEDSYSVVSFSDAPGFNPETTEVVPFQRVNGDYFTLNEQMKESFARDFIGQNDY